MFIETGPLLVIIIRLLVPFSIFRWPLWGTVASAIVDLLDVVMIDIFKMGDFANYSAVDKALDTYYLLFTVIVALKWEAIAKWTSISLFAYRVIGVIIFEIFQVRWLLFVFPNLYENWFIFWAARNRYFPKFKLTIKKLFIILGVLLIPKMFQEWLLHVSEAQPWNWIQSKTNLLK